MRGKWERGTVIPFRPDSSVQAQMYRWHKPAELGRGSIQFLAPVAELPRRFFCGPLLDAWFRDEAPTKFLDETCRLGATLLREYDFVVRSVAANGTADPSTTVSAAPEAPPEAIEFFRAIFRNRLAGRSTLTRAFRRADDFYGSGGRRAKDRFVVPGFRLAPGDGGRLKTPEQLIEEVQRAVVSASSHHSATADGRVEVPIDRLSQRSLLDLLLVDGVERDVANWSLAAVWDSVSQALINGIDLSRDSELAARDPEEHFLFCRRLVEAFCRRRRKPSEFDRWLRTEREHGFVRLMPGASGLRREDREQAALLAASHFRLVLWAAYEAMARCYGAVMLLAWMDFCEDGALKPSLTEQLLFRQVNAPQLYLAGLPFAFFLKGQLRWVLGPFLERLGEERSATEQFDPLTTLLGLYAASTQALHGAEREKKARQRAKEASGVPPMGEMMPHRGHRDLPPTEGETIIENLHDDDRSGAVFDRACYDRNCLVDSPMDFPLLESNQCSHCDGPLDLLGTPTLSGGWLIVDTLCTSCNREGTFRISAPS